MRCTIPGLRSPPIPDSVSPQWANSALTSSESQTCLFNNGTNALFTRCWGRNDTRQLGLASNGDQLTAVQAPAFTDGRLIAEITFGTFFGCAILEDIDINIPITVRCWGSNAQGQLGDGTTVDKFADQSVDIVGLNDPRQVAAGRAHACVREFLGTVKCWGSDTSGELGDGAAVGPVGVPVTVTGLSNVLSLAVSRDGSHTCALLNDGSARCWGANLSGQLGNGNITNQNAPVVVSGSHVFNQLITGISHSCGRLTNGEVRCWGSNQLDQLGVAAVFSSNTPVVVDGLNVNVTQLIGGPLFNCALQSSAWKCWGYNSSGELGNGKAAVALLPVQVQTPNILLSDGFE